MTIKVDNCQLEIDIDRGVIYVHSPETGGTLVRICQIDKRRFRDFKCETSLLTRQSIYTGLIDIEAKESPANRKLYIQDITNMRDIPERS